MSSTKSLVKLTPNQVDQEIKSLNDWRLNDSGEIERIFEFKDFKESTAFVNAVAWIAERVNHHPDILIQWNKVRLSVLTHDAGGLTTKDFDLAKEVDRL